MDLFLIWLFVVASMFDIVPSNWPDSDYTNASKIQSDVIVLSSKFQVIHQLILSVV